jgi:hypothetical protein
VFVGLAFGLLFVDRGWRALENSAWVSGVVFCIWLASALLKWSVARYSAWRLRTVGAGEAPAGSNPLADKVTAIALTSALLSIALSIVALRVDKATLGIILQVWLIIAMVGVMFRVPRFRWEAVLASIAIAAFAYPYIRGLGAASLEETFYSVGPGALSTGVLAVLLVDVLHARHTRQALADVREGVSVPLCVLAAAGVLLAWFF